MNPASRHAAQTQIAGDLIALLRAVERAGSFYFESLSPVSPTHEQLRQLEALGYIRYCRYPEEFWVMLPPGKELLSRLLPGW
jgi:hypothetical protein